MNILGILKVVQTVATFIPLVEGMFKGRGRGAEKKEAATEGTVSTVTTEDPDFGAILDSDQGRELIGKLIDLMVKGEKVLK